VKAVVSNTALPALQTRLYMFVQLIENLMEVILKRLDYKPHHFTMVIAGASNSPTPK
jgi:hypothetical protein